MNSQRILIVDDDLDLQRMLRTCLQDTGYTVEQAIDGAQALQAIERLAPDVVLLDLAMPVLDGMSVLADLRPLGEQHSLRVIVMTATGSARTALQAVRLGAADFLEKPFSPEDLRQSIDRVVSGAVSDDAGLVARHGLALQLVRDAWRRGKFYAAEAALARASFINDHEPCFLNLAGVLQEAHGRLEHARRFYQRAIAVDAGYEPAHYNLKRLCQIEQTGYTRLEAALGDEPGPPAGQADAASSADRFRDLLLGNTGGEGKPKWQT
jgi:CheY-like chemotaxis protein